MREGTDVTLVAFGKLVGYNLKVAEELEKEGISCEVCFPLPVAGTSRHLQDTCLSLPCPQSTVPCVICAVSLTGAGCEPHPCR